ncbi:MAG: hypothetical protein ACYCOU_19050, partial [Sulfobacillus sp.]
MSVCLLAKEIRPGTARPPRDGVFGTDFRHAVEFSRNGRALPRTPRPSAGQPAQYPCPLPHRQSGGRAAAREEPGPITRMIPGRLLEVAPERPRSARPLLRGARAILGLATGPVKLSPGRRPLALGHLANGGHQERAGQERAGPERAGPVHAGTRRGHQERAGPVHAGTRRGHQERAGP